MTRVAGRSAGARDVTAHLRRLVALGALLFVAVYLLPGWLGGDRLPWGVRAAWPLAAVLAVRWPGPSWLAFVTGAPLLPVVPELREWPSVPLTSLWLSALLVPAWLRVVWTGGRPTLPGWATIFLALVTASLVAAMAPFAAGGAPLAEHLAALHGFLRDDLPQLSGQRHVYASVLAWLIVAEGAAAGWLAWGYLRDHGERGLIAMSAAAVTGATLVASWGIRQWWTRENLLPFWREFDPFIVRVNASFTDVNALGSYLAAMAVVAAAAAVSARGAWRWAAGAATVVIATATVFTASRVAWGGMVLAMLGYAALAHRAGAWSLPAITHLRRARRLALAAVLAPVVGLAGLTAYATAVDARHIEQRSYFDTVMHTLNLRVSPADKLKGRLPLWGAAWRMAESRPLTGIGIGRYFKDVSAYADPDARLIQPQENAHNYFLQLAAECGPPTLLAWLAMIAAVVSASWRAVRSLSADSRHLVCGGMAGLFAFLLTCVTGHPLLLREGQLAFWVLLALAGAAALVVSPRRASRRTTLAVAAALLVVVVSLPFRVEAEVTSVDLTRLPVGLHEVEEAADGSTFQWTREKATLFLPAESRRVTLAVRSLAPFPQHVRVLLDGDVVDELTLDHHAWRPMQYVLPRHRSHQRYRRLVLEVRPTWQPEGDARALGVMLRAFDWSR